jgi:hypothetical protein
MEKMCEIHQRWVVSRTWIVDPLQSWNSEDIIAAAGRFASWPAGQAAHVGLQRVPDGPHLPPMPPAGKDGLRGCLQPVLQGLGDPLAVLDIGLRPGTCLMCWALAKSSSTSPSRMFHTGFQETPVDSMAMCGARLVASQPAMAKSAAGWRQAGGDPGGAAGLRRGIDHRPAFLEARVHPGPQPAQLLGSQCQLGVEGAAAVRRQLVRVGLADVELGLQGQGQVQVSSIPAASAG